MAVNHMRRFACATAMAVVSACPALAQNAPASTDLATTQNATESSGPGSGDIIVTAQRREQTLQQVPVAVSTVSAAQIEARGLNNVDQLTNIAPNLLITPGNSSSSSTQIAIRGSVTTNNTINYDPAVGLYLDGVYIGKASGSVFDIGDLERVEVLRGPQGTLFGRNTLAGAISFITRKPSDKFRLEGELSYGNYQYFGGRGVVNVPITDNLFVKGAGTFQLREGFTKLVPGNVFPIQATGRVDDRNRYSVLGQVRWEVSDRLAIDYSYDRSQTREHPMVALAGVGRVGAGDPGFDLDELLAETGLGTGNIFDPLSPNYSGLPLADFVVPGDNRPKRLAIDQRPTDNSRVYGHALNIAYDFGQATLRSITAYRNVRVRQGPLAQDIDGSPFPIALGGFNTDYDQTSQELQLAGGLFDDRLSYVVGGFYFEDDAKADNAQSYFVGSTILDTRIMLKSRAYALYGQADFKATDRFTVTGGLRWNSERKTVGRLYRVVASDGFVFDPPLTIIDIDYDDKVRKTFSNVSPTAILAYQLADDLNLYAKYSVGFRSGNFNGDAGPSNSGPPDADVRQPYAPEKNESIEVGFKSRFFDRRVTLNVAAFYNTEKNKQVASFVSEQAASTINRNAGKARVRGIEAELDAWPTQWLHLYGNIGLLRTKFLSYEDVVTFGPEAGTVVDVADNRYFAKAPRTTASGGADVTVFESDSGSVTVSGDFEYQSKVYALPGAYRFDVRFPLVATADQYRLPSVFRANARIRWDEIRLGASGLEGYAMLWAKNFTNYRKINNKIVFGPNFGGLIDANYSDPRTYGVTFGFKY